eukprot:scaffold170272_cov33-Tisochrysis_lutea.AAC.1
MSAIMPCKMLCKATGYSVHDNYSTAEGDKSGEPVTDARSKLGPPIDLSATALTSPQTTYAVSHTAGLPSPQPNSQEARRGFC